MSVLGEGDHQHLVVRLIAKKTGLPTVQIFPESRLVHDLGIAGDDAGELLTEYSETFQVDMSEFDFAQYFSGEPHLFKLAEGLKLAPITVQDLVEAARQKKWPPR